MTTIQFKESVIGLLFDYIDPETGRWASQTELWPASTRTIRRGFDGEYSGLAAQAGRVAERADRRDVRMAWTPKNVGIMPVEFRSMSELDGLVRATWHDTPQLVDGIVTPQEPQGSVLTSSPHRWLVLGRNEGGATHLVNSYFSRRAAEAHLAPGQWVQHTVRPPAPLAVSQPSRSPLVRWCVFDQQGFHRATYNTQGEAEQVYPSSYSVVRVEIPRS